MGVIQRDLLSKTEGNNMTSEAGHRGEGLQLCSNQGSVQIKATRKNVLSRPWALFQVLSSICFRWLLLMILTMAFMVTHAHGEELTGICRKLMDPPIVNPATIGLSPCSSTKQLSMQHMNACIPHVHRKVENDSPDPLGPLISSRANVKVVVTVLAFIGGIALVGWMLYKRWQAFTEADINMGLMSEPATPRQSDPTFKIHPRIE